MTEEATPGDLGSTEGLGRLVPCPICGASKGYELTDGSTFRWWLVGCVACGADVAECRSDSGTKLGAPKPQRWKAADEAWNEAGGHAHKLRTALLDIAEAARLSPYRDANQWDDALAKLIARKAEFLRA